MRIAVLSNTTWYLHNFRLNLMLALQQAGFEVFAIGPEDDYVERIQQAGITHLPFNVSGDGTNPWQELKVLYQLYNTLKKNRIKLVLSNTPKGNIYSNLATLPLSSHVLPNVSGLGRTFIKKGMTTLIVKNLYRFTFLFNKKIFFQNTDDKNLFIKLKLIKEQQALLLPGSGVDLQRFKLVNIDSEQRKTFTFILMARLLWDKGIGEYAEAARIIKHAFPHSRFILLGESDVANPAAIPSNTIIEWQKSGVIEYLGKTDDVIPHIANADCVVLPSYREGTPRSLLEAAAMGKPVITTDTVGCRNTVDHEITGYLCKLKNAEDLAEKMRILIELPVEKRQIMGSNARQKMEQEFDEQIVIQTYLNTINTFYPR